MRWKWSSEQTSPCVRRNVADEIACAHTMRSSLPRVCVSNDWLSSSSARSGALLVRQFAAESSEGCTLWIRTERELWREPARFELLVGFAATYAEDLFRQGRLRAVAIGREAPRPVRGVRDLEELLDRLALAAPVPQNQGSGSLSTLHAR